MGDEDEKRRSLVEASRRAVRTGMNGGTTGNMSLKHGTGMLITPTGIAPDCLEHDQIVEVSLDGQWTGTWRPSSEWAIHARIYRQTAAQAVVHAHPDNCVALSCLRLPIPPFHYMVAGFGGDEIPCARYETFGSPELSDAVADALGSRYQACLMASHGMVAIGPDLSTAFARAEKLETLARQYLLALGAGTPVMLTAGELAAVHARYPTYGQQPGG
jgi:L-fuculose-phosphate aldolase